MGGENRQKQFYFSKGKHEENTFHVVINFHIWRTIESDVYFKVLTLPLLV